MADLAAVILAAGKGTRMKSNLPKVLHPIGGRSMLDFVIDAVRRAGVEKTAVVVGHGAEEVKAHLPADVDAVIQQPQLGTGHAVMQALPFLKEENVLVLCGDTPLLRGETLEVLYEKHSAAGARVTVLTTIVSTPSGYGRIKRFSDGRFEAIVEEKDASPGEKSIKEVNTGVYCFKRDALVKALAQISPNNAQGEYYLTDTLGVTVSGGEEVHTVLLEDWTEMAGINNRVQLAEAAAVIRRRTLEELMENGVTVIDPASTYIDVTVTVAPDTVIYPQTYLEGNTSIGPLCKIGPGSKITDSAIGRGVTLQYSVLLEADVGDNCNIGPFAYLRPGTQLSAGVKVGDFVEIKNARVGPGAKVPHLSYIGDSLVGEKVNIGAGTITCNYDGKKKSTTVIGDGAFIGSNTNLVAPVEVGANSIIGAGSTITKNVPPGALAVGRSRQKNFPGWYNRKKD